MNRLKRLRPWSFESLGLEVVTGTGSLKLFPEATDLPSRRTLGHRGGLFRRKVREEHLVELPIESVLAIVVGSIEGIALIPEVVAAEGVLARQLGWSPFSE